jgi:putative thioredoxin
VRLQGNPDDHDARYKLATIQFLRGQTDVAIEQLMDIVKRDRSWNDDQARKQLLKFFDALGPANPATLKGRRKLSTVLFS